MKNSLALAAILLLAPFAASHAADSRATKSRPNILFLPADDLGGGDQH